MQQNLKCLDTYRQMYRALVEYDGEQLRADYHVRFRKGWSQEVEYVTGAKNSSPYN